MTLEQLTGAGVPSGIGRGVITITPSDTEDNVPSNSIGFVIYYTAGSEVDGTVDIIDGFGEDEVWPFIDRHLYYLVFRRFKAANFPANAVVKAVVI